MSTPSVRPTPDPVLGWLRITTAVTAVLSIVQLLLGVGLLGSLSGVFPVHRTLGYIAFLAAVAAAVFAVLWSRRSGNKGLMFHTISVAVLGLIQVGIGEMGVVWLHVVVGLLFLVDAVAASPLSFRKPGSVLQETHTED
jgi:hypothetical protein